MAEYPETKTPRLDAAIRAPQSGKGLKILFMAILLSGLLVRLAHINGESVWWDEFATVAFLKAPPAYEDSPYFDQWNQVVIRQPSPTPGAFLRQNRDLDPAAMPLYLLIEYYWNCYVNASPLALRLLSLLFGLAVLPVTFLLGKHLYGPVAGLIAMGCVALSPIHVQFSREIRMYGLMTLLAVSAVYAFCRLLEDKGLRWRILYGVSILLLSWNHPFALLLPFVMGVFWLIAFPGDFMRLFKWGLLTAVVVMPAALWVLTIQFWGQDSTESWMRVPNLVELLNDIFADDAIGATYQVNASPTAWAWLLGEDLARRIIAWRWTVGQIALVAVVAALLWLFIVSAGYRRHSAEWTGLKGGPVSCFKKSMFLSLWALVPPLILYALSVVWRPCHQPRYTVHSSVALYLILGGAVMSLPKKALRMLGVTCLILFYGYQQMLMLGEPQHPDWLGASRAIRGQANSGDLVLAHNWLWKRVFAYNLGPVPNIVCYGSSYEILAEKSAFFLELHAGAETGPKGVWVVVQTDYFTQGTIPQLEREFEVRGLSYTAREFSGIQRVILYHVRRTPDTPRYEPLVSADSLAPKEFADLAMEFWRAREYETAIAAAQAALRINPQHARSWSYLGMSFKELERNTEALEAFQRALEIDPDDYPWTLNNHAELLILAGRYQDAVTIALKALEALPGDPWCLALLGRAYYNLGDFQRAREALEEAVQGGGQDMRIPQWLDETKKAMVEGGSHE